MTKPETVADGIYLDMPFETYVNTTALSKSGVKDLLISPLDYWTNSANNPEREDDDTAATGLGKMFEEMALEGLSQFQQRYAVKPEGMSFATKDGKVWKAAAIEAGKAIVSHDDYKTMLRMMLSVEESGAQERFLTGGLPQVSFFWSDPDGQQYRCRFDYLKPDMQVELKTFSNSARKPLDVAFMHSIAYENYLIDAYFYSKAWAEMYERKHLWPNHPVFDQMSDNPSYWFLFVQTGKANNVVARRFRQFGADGAENNYWHSAVEKVALALSIHRRYMAEKGPSKPWIADCNAKEFADEDFPLWYLEQ
jgi:hypothetical protein